MDAKAVEKYVSLMLTEGLGFDLSDPNLTDTPKRIAKMYCNEFFAKCDCEFDSFRAFPNEKGYDQIILLDTVFFVSTCAHHFLPFTGHAWLAYLPGDKLVGASKPARLINHYAARPQLQETLCHDALGCFVKHMQPRGASVVIRGSHGCMKCRGAKQPNSGMVTAAHYGEMLTSSTAKSEVFELIKLSILHTLP